MTELGDLNYVLTSTVWTGWPWWKFLNLGEKWILSFIRLPSSGGVEIPHKYKEYLSLSININRYDVKPSKVTLWGRERQPMHFFIWVSFLKALRSIILFVNYPSLEYPVGTGLPSCWETRNQRCKTSFSFRFLEFTKYDYSELLPEGSIYTCSFLNISTVYLTRQNFKK